MSYIDKNGKRVFGEVPAEFHAALIEVHNSLEDWYFSMKESAEYAEEPVAMMAEVTEWWNEIRECMDKIESGLCKK